MVGNLEVEYKAMARLGPSRTQHENWVKSAIPTARVEVLESERSITAHLKCDLVFRVNAPDPFWAEIGDLIAHREVIFEHHSNSISRDNFIGCVIKQATYTRERRQRGVPAREFSPCLVMTSYQRPRVMLRHSDFRNIGTPGIYTQGGYDNRLILVVTSQLPRESRYNFLRLLSRAPKPDEIESLGERLMEIRELTRVEREKIKEAAMAQTAERERALSAIKKIAKVHVDLEMRLEETQALLQQALQEKDEALEEKEEALQEKEEALRRAQEELERMRRLLDKS
jgi:DNA repair exonuclease SbcCD ATPase subunit